MTQPGRDETLVPAHHPNQHPETTASNPEPVALAITPTHRRASSRFPLLATVGVNITMIAVNLGASVIVARELGASGRGTFATLFAVFSLALVLADIGQSSSVTYFTARDTAQRAGWVCDGRRIMVAGGLVVTTVGVALTGPLGLNAGISSVDLALVISACLINGIAAPSVFALQAISISTWNAVRLIQPCVYTLLVALVFVVAELTIHLLAVLLVVSVAVSLLCATVIGRARGLGHGIHDRARSSKMLRYGAAAYASGLPVAIVQNGDRLVIIALLSATDVGHYAVAVSVISLTSPVAIAIASIQFPRIAALEHDLASTRPVVVRTLWSSSLVIVPATVAVAAVGQWLMPAVFGADFLDARWLLWALIPVGFLRSMSIVTSGLLRGLGRPGVPAIAQTASMILLAITIVPACLAGGLGGLVAALIVAEVLALTICLPPLWKAPA